MYEMTSDQSLSPAMQWTATLTFVAAATFLIWLVQHLQPKAKRDYWSSLPLSGSSKGWFTRLKAGYWSIDNMQKALRHTYDKPVFANDPYVMLPPSTLKNLVSIPDRLVSNYEIHKNDTQPFYTMPKAVAHDVFKFEIVKKYVTKSLPLLVDEVRDEMIAGFETYWGTDTNKTVSINVVETCKNIVSRAANRVFTGPELCRNEGFLENMQQATSGVFDGAQRITMFPEWTRPVIGRVIARFNQKYMDKCAAYLEPVIQNRLKNIARKNEDPTFNWKTPVSLVANHFEGTRVNERFKDDALQYSIEQAIQKNKPEELAPNVLAARMLALNMVAIHTTVLATCNVLLDLYSSPDADSHVQALREEIDIVLAANNGVWNRDTLSEMHKLDSVLRESMRFSSQEFIAVQRLITSKEPIDIGHNIKIPNGVQVAIPSDAIHSDERNYPSAHEFKPFRFVQSHTSSNPNPNQTQNHHDSQDDKQTTRPQTRNLVVTDTDDKFLYFGHGRHACPGRFFATQEIKLFLAHVVCHYDVEKLLERPANVTFGSGNYVDASVCLRVKRRI